MAKPLNERIRVLTTETLSEDWYVLKKTTFEFLRNDGTWQKQSRETYDRGDGVTILLYNVKARTVILTKQFRYPAFVSGFQDLMIEAPAGVLDDAAPELRIKHEVEEETGYEIKSPKKIFECFMSPGAVTETLHFFVAEYEDHHKVSEGGGKKDEGEDIEVLEVKFEDALAQIQAGKIKDAKTIMLLQYAALHIFK